MLPERVPEKETALAHAFQVSHCESTGTAEICLRLSFYWSGVRSAGSLSRKILFLDSHSEEMSHVQQSCSVGTAEGVRCSCSKMTAGGDSVCAGGLGTDAMAGSLPC